MLYPDQSHRNSLKTSLLNKNLNNLVLVSYLTMRCIILIIFFFIIMDVRTSLCTSRLKLIRMISKLLNQFVHELNEYLDNRLSKLKVEGVDLGEFKMILF